MEEYKLTGSKRKIRGTSQEEQRLIEAYDKADYPIPKDCGEALEKIYFDNPTGTEYLYGVYWSMEDFSKIFANGIALEPKDHEIFSADAKRPVIGSRKISNTMQIVNLFYQLIYHVKRSRRNSYIVKIPREYLVEKTKPILFNDNGVMRLLPEFIFGVVRKDGNGKALSFVYNPAYRDIHNYNNEGLETNSDITKEEYPAPVAPITPEEKPSLGQKVKAAIAWAKLRKVMKSRSITPEDSDDQYGPNQSNGGNVVHFK